MALALPATAVQATPLPSVSTSLLATPHLQSGDLKVYGASTDPATAIPAVTPDVAYTKSGIRVEVYTSAGDNDGAKADWRSVNEYAYLINSVPKGKNLYSTVFNALYDYGKAKLNSTTGDYSIVDSSGDVIADTSLFRPTIAFRNQINQYADNDEAQQYVHVLGAKESMTEAYNAPSSLARLLDASGVMQFCTKKATTGTTTGACLTTGAVNSDALMHSKYSLFEQTKDSTGKVWDDVIWVTSANLNGASGGKKSNTSVAIYGDSAGYNGLLNNVWTPSVTQTLTAGYKNAMTNGVSSSDPDFSYWPSPRILKDADADSADFEADTLKAATAVSGKTDCKAYLAHSLFNSSRQALLDDLAKLQTQGCDVKIMLGDNAIVDTVDAYFGMSNKAREVIDRVEFGNVHDKAITVSYTAGGTSYGTTWGGSANANGTSLSHDELAFRAESLTVTRAVELQMERVYALIRGGKTNTQVTALAISPATASIDVGQTFALQPRFTPSDATIKTVTWTSSNTAVATVDATTGKVTAKASGSTTITATSLSGNRTATAEITVQGTGDDTPTTGESTASANVLYTPPTLSMDNYQQTLSSTGENADTRRTDVVVTWGTGTTDITGKVALQYYSSGWHTKAYVNVVDGRGTTQVSLSSSRAWRLVAKSANGFSIGSSAKVSSGYSYTLVKTRTNTSTPRIYAPSMAKQSDLVPFLVTVTNPKGTMRLQYLAGSGWKTKLSFTFGGGTQKMVSVPIGSTRKWRFVTSTKRSTSVTVKILS